MSKYFALLTHIGAAKLANATALGSRLNITQMAVGDANGVLPMPNPAQTQLINEKRRAAINTLSVDPKNPSQIIAEQVIPESEGGFWIREIGLYDEGGNLIAVANCPETYKPQLQEGSGRIQTVRMILIVSSTDAVTLKIDPAVVLATRSYVDNAVIEVKAYADSLMKAHLADANPHNQYAPKVSPALTGKPTAPTATQTANDTQLATTAFVKTAISALINGSPGALDTLQELAKAMGNDPNFSTTVLNALAEKLPLSGGAMSGPIVSSSADALRLINGDYGVILRSDGSDFYLLQTDKGNKNGQWNNLRPFRINLATGNVSLSHQVDAWVLLEKGQRVYSPNNKPTAADVGALTDAQAAQKYAKLESPALIGKPTAPTAVQAANDTQIATTAFVKSAISALVNGSPGALDTLQELAKALGNDPNFSTTVLNEVAKKLSLSGGTLTGQLTIDNILKVTGPGATLPDSQGAHLCWNRENGSGRTDFVNHRGSGSGGFAFWNGDHNTLTKLAELQNSGAFNISGAISEAGKRVYSPNNKPSAADIGALPANGGSLTGNVTITNDSKIQWARNSDYALIGFKNDADGDANSYMYFRTGDNGNEYFRWEHTSPSSSPAAEWMSLKADGLRIQGNLAYHAGNKPTAADIGAISASELAGIPLPWPLATAPTGWLKCNGQAFNKTTYPKLAAAYPSGKLPDLRGEFIRGVDDGRGVDTGRTLLSAQNDAMQPITAGWTIDDQTTDSNYPPSGALYFDNLGAVNYDAGSGRGRNGAQAHFDSSRVTRTASETRPRNIAFNYIVRAA